MPLRSDDKIELERFFALSVDMLAIVSLENGRMKKVNAAMCRTTGWSEEELLQAPAFEFVHPDDLEKSRQATEELREGGDLLDFEHRMRCKDGSYRWISWHTASYPEEGVLYCIGRDMTQRRESDDALRESEVRFRTLADNISQFAWMADSKGWIFWYNQRWYEYTGTTLEEMQGWGWKKVHHPDHVERVVEKIQRSWDSGEVWEDVFPLRGKDGEYRWFLSRALPILDDSGQVARWFGTNTDITEQRKAEEALRESEQLIKSVADSAPAMLYMTDRDFCCTFLSRRWYEFTGQEMGAGLGYGWLNAVHPDDTPMVQRTFSAASAKEAPFDLDYRLRTASGDYRWVVDSGRAWTGEDGEFLGYIGSVIDVHERKEAERAVRVKAQELKRSNAELQNFAYVASHDLQEPLRSINGFAQLLLKRHGAQLTGDAKEYLDMVVSSANRMSELIKGLLAYSRFEQAGNLDADVDMEELLKVVLTNLNGALESSGGKVTHDSLPVVKGEGFHLRQLLQNLIGNSLKYRRPEVAPEVHVSSEEGQDEWKFCVRDNGIGIPERNYDQVFLIFRRLHQWDKYEGTGIGLAICKKIVEGHSGKIWVEAKVGEGSSFYFTLPKR